MGGGLMQLVAYGAQDIYLTGNPQITFFKVVYRRHTNFSMESIAQTFSGAQGFGSKVTATIARNGDLVHKMALEFDGAALFGAVAQTGVVANLGNTLIEEVDLEIGGQRIDKHYGHWLTVWENLTQPNPLGEQSVLVNTAGPSGGVGQEALSGNTLSQRRSYNHLGTDLSNGAAAAAALGAPTNISVPLQFWFCRNPGLALPLIALQYHEVKVSVKFTSAAANIAQANIGTPNTTLFVDYIYLDTDERRRFAQQSHEYLIEQLQFQQQGSATAQNTILNFNHPVKELIWTGVPETATAVGTTAHQNASRATPGRVGTAGVFNAAATTDGTDRFCLKLNGHERFAPRPPAYFTRTQVHQHHTGFGGVTQSDSIAVYSFALKPEEHQPSGTCNFSRIDNAIMDHPVHAAVGAVVGVSGRGNGLNFYAVNYNVLRVMSGMGGLAYSN
jgi:hypothetical protein